MKSNPTRLRRALAVVAVSALALSGCSSGDGDAQPSAAAEKVSGEGVWDSSQLHEFSIDIDPDVLAQTLATYTENGDKEWIEATVTIDGQTFEKAGLRLKGNSSLRGITAESEPTELPWKIKLDKFVKGAELDGTDEFVVRSNSSETALNEAVALELLAEAGLASEHAIATSFVVNGAEAQLRLVIQELDGAWEDENFDTSGMLYKSEAEGDWSYRGEDPASYEDVFDQETGQEDLTPLIDFLDFLNNSSDDEFVEQLPDRLDVEAFATYLAFEDLIGNFDDIDGPGNNSFLRYDSEAESFTVVAWDHNLAFGGVPGGMGEGGFPGGGQLPEGMEAPDFGGGQMPQPPEGMEAPDFGGGQMPQLPEGMELPDGMEPPGAMGEGPGGGGPRGGSNILVERFTAVPEWAQLVEDATAELTEKLYGSGLAEQILQRWSALLTEQAAELVDPEVVQSDAQRISQVVAGD